MNIIRVHHPICYLLQSKTNNSICASNRYIPQVPLQVLVVRFGWDLM